MVQRIQNQPGTQDSRQWLVTWLKDAYGMEQALVPVLENHAKDFKDHPEVQERISLHVNQTKQHANIVKDCLGLLGEKPSATKSAIGKFTGMVQGSGTGMAKDELIKDVLSDYASEQFEIACYKSLIDAAEQVGDQQIVQACRGILEQEEEMARWLDQHIDQVTREVMIRTKP